MAQSMKRPLIVLFGALVCLPALAQQLQDPTRPPSNLTQPDALAGAGSGPVLQSVFISPTHKVAIISDHTVKLGEKFNGATLVKITESEVMLRNGSEFQTLKLFPNIGKRLTPGHNRKNPDNRK
ncbi:MSHA biogenesis protein MshK [Herminiimonas arsenitoxidans]|uniref:MSHA biogenesis protein MshK n=1 Tax=Herminiimonas arsenitoxidans TaxID=1809410 RepID=UPI001E3004A6|nr:MSHA biogenesis protein MshK [Herminiimonas arsenitoxidans]